MGVLTGDGAGENARAGGKVHCDEGAADDTAAAGPRDVGVVGRERRRSYRAGEIAVILRQTPFTYRKGKMDWRANASSLTGVARTRAAGCLAREPGDSGYRPYWVV